MSWYSDLWYYKMQLYKAQESGASKEEIERLEKEVEWHEQLGNEQEGD